MRRVLMIAYFFPPDITVRRTRTVKFCKYLPQFGWTPVVLAPEVEPHLDPDPYGEIPAGTEVHRFARDDFHPWLLTKAQEIRETAGKIRRMLRGGEPDESGGEGGPVFPLGKGNSLSVLLRMLTYWPDDRCTWILPAVRKGLALGRSCDAIYSTGNPWSDHAVASRVKRFTGLPWIMDFRDPWMLGGVLEYPFSLQRRILHRLERRWVGQCDRVLQTTDPYSERYRAAYSNQPACKFLTLPNGFDPTDFDRLPSPKGQLPMTMTYLGNISADRDPGALFSALIMLRSTSRVTPGELRVRLIGRGTLAQKSRVDRSGLCDMIDLVPLLPYRAALKALAKSHVALLIGGPRFEHTAVPTKLYEYLAMRKFILAIVPQGFMRTKLESIGVPCADCGDSEAIAEMIHDALIRFRRDKKLPPPGVLPEMQQLTRKHLTRRLAGLLDEIARR